MPADREEIGQDEILYRHIFDPPMFPGGTLIAKFFFEFPKNQCESVIWLRHVGDGAAGVHRFGCARQKTARQRQRDAGKRAEKTYIGAASAKTGEINAYRNPNGHGVLVVHEPDEGHHHAELCYASEPGSPTMTPSDK